MAAGLDGRRDVFRLCKGVGGRRKVGNTGGEEECSFVSGIVSFNLRMLLESFNRKCVSRENGGVCYKHASRQPSTTGRAILDISPGISHLNNDNANILSQQIEWSSAV